jgi:hypothetical protein
MRILFAILFAGAVGVCSIFAQETKRSNQVEIQIQTPAETLTIRGEMGCKIENEWDNISRDIRWFGECKDGVAHGRGAARWYKDGLLALEIAYTGANGLIRRNGKAVVEKSEVDKRIKLTMGSCDRTAGYRSVRVDADRNLALHHNWIVSFILAERAQKQAWERCPTGNFSNVDVNFYFGNNRVIHARSYAPVEGPSNPYKTNWQEFGNNVQAEYMARFDQFFRQAASQRQQEQQKKAQDQARLAAEQQKQRMAAAKQATRDDFTSRFGAKRFTNEQQLHTNPFLFKDQVIGVHTAFGRMIASDEALFMLDGVGATALIVTGVPSTQFSVKSQVMLAVRVVGTRSFKTGAGEVVLPHGQYVGVHFCLQQNCAEIY